MAARSDLICFSVVWSRSALRLGLIGENDTDASVPFALGGDTRSCMESHTKAWAAVAIATTTATITLRIS
jgi:hypothetical protein